VSPRTNGMSVAAMVVSLVSICGLCFYGFGGLLGVLGAVLGHVSRRQIKTNHEGGAGMALAGIVIGWIVTGLGILIGIGWVIFFIMTVNDPAFQTDPRF
jgi:hypothetical protein